MKKFLRYGQFVALPLALLLPLSAQNPKPASEGITRQQADDILTELRQIRQLLEKQQAKDGAPKGEQFAKVKIAVGDAPLLGSKDAPLTIVEFTDYQCPFCQQFHNNTFPELKKAYIDTGKARFYSRDLPLDFHANAMRAAQAGRCAADQGQAQFWKLRDVMAANPNRLEMADLIADATGLKMDVGTFKACVESGKYKNAVQSDSLEAMRIGAEGTPSFVIGRSTPDGVDGELLVGAQPFPVFDLKLRQFDAIK